MTKPSRTSLCSPRKSSRACARSNRSPSNEPALGTPPGLFAPAMLAQRDIEAGGDDDCGAGPSQSVGEISEDQVTEDRSPDQLDVTERGEDRGRTALEGAGDQVMPGATDQAEADEQRQIE